MCSQASHTCHGLSRLGSGLLPAKCQECQAFNAHTLKTPQSSSAIPGALNHHRPPPLWKCELFWEQKVPESDLRFATRNGRQAGGQDGGPHGRMGVKTDLESKGKPSFRPRQPSRPHRHVTDASNANARGASPWEARKESLPPPATKGSPLSLPPLLSPDAAGALGSHAARPPLGSHILHTGSPRRSAPPARQCNVAERWSSRL